MKDIGKIRAWGVSNFDVQDLEELAKAPGGNHVAANEDLYNLGSRGIDFDLVAYQSQRQIPLIAYSPVANGDQLGAQLTQNDSVQRVATRHHATRYQVLLAWTIRNGETLTIPKASSVDHMLGNMAAGQLTLTELDLLELDRAYPEPTQKQPLAVL